MTICKPNFLAPKGTMVYRADKDPDVDMSLPPFDLGVAQGAAYSKMLLEVFANDVPNEIKVRAKSVVCGGYLSGICDDATLAASEQMLAAKGIDDEIYWDLFDELDPDTAWDDYLRGWHAGLSL